MERRIPGERVDSQDGHFWSRVALVSLRSETELTGLVGCLLAVDVVPVLAESLSHACRLLEAVPAHLAVIEGVVADEGAAEDRLDLALVDRSVSCGLLLVGRPREAPVPNGVPVLRAGLGPLALALEVERRVRPVAADGLRWGPLALDVPHRAGHWYGEPLHLSPTQFRILTALVHAGGRVVTRTELCRQVFGSAVLADLERLDAHLRRIRKILEVDPGHPTFLLTVRGEGVRLADCPPAAAASLPLPLPLPRNVASG